MGSSGARFSGVYAVNFYGTAASAKYADLAERYASDKAYEHGTVVCLGGSQEITASSQPGDENVFGVISTNPAYLMNAEHPSDTNPAVAMSGRVPCKVVGVVSKGERLMASSLEGVACPWIRSYGHLAIIGRSLVDKTSHGVELIEIVVGKN